METSLRIRIGHSWPLMVLVPTLLYVFFELAVALFQPVRTDDIFWHLKIGEILLHEKSFHVEESLLFTHDPDLKPLYHEWLFQIVVKSVENFGGLYALRFFLPLCVLGILWAFLRFLRLFKFDSTSSLLAVLIFILFSYQRLIQLRPELFSMICFFVLLQNFVRGRESFSLWRILLAIFVSIFWANSHSLCLIIFPFWGLWIGSAWIYSRVFKHFLSFDWKGQISGFLGSVAAMSVNPMGLGLFYFYFKGNARNPYVNVIDEWGHFNFFGLRDYLPLSSEVLMGGMSLLILWSALVFSVLVWDLRNKGHSEEAEERFHLFFLGGAALLSLGPAAYAVRFFWLAFFPALMLLKYFQTRPFISSRMLQVCGLFLLCGAALWHFRMPGTLSYRFPLVDPLARSVFWKWNYDKSKYHHRSVNFLKKTGVEGRIFNPYFMGGFLSYRLNPKVRVFIDGRFEHYTEQVNRDFFQLKNVGTHFQGVIQKYGIDLFFVPVEKESVRMLLTLRKIGWVVLYHDETTVIFSSPAVFANADLKRGLIRHYAESRKEAQIPVEDANRFSEFVEAELRAKWKVDAESLKNKTAEEIRALYRESLENWLLNGFLEEALEFFNGVSDRIRLDDPFFSYFCEVFAQRNQLDCQFSEKK